MESLIALDRRTPVMRWRDVRDESSLWGDLRPELAGAVSVILHATMEDELAALLAARPYERSLRSSRLSQRSLPTLARDRDRRHRTVCATSPRYRLSALVPRSGGPTHELSLIHI